MRTSHTLGLFIAGIITIGCTTAPGTPEVPTSPAGVTPQAQVATSTARPQGEAPLFVVAADGDGNQLTVDAKRETTVIDVTSDSGIGSATVDLVSGAPPENIVLRLHLKGLEEFRLSYDGSTVTASLPGSDPGGLIESTLLADGGEQPITPDSPLWLNVRIQDHFEVTLPKNFLNDERRTFTIRWIDFYR